MTAPAVAPVKSYGCIDVYILSMVSRFARSPGSPVDPADAYLFGSLYYLASLLRALHLLHNILMSAARFVPTT